MRLHIGVTLQACRFFLRPNIVPSLSTQREFPFLFFRCASIFRKTLICLLHLIRLSARSSPVIGYLSDKLDASSRSRLRLRLNGVDPAHRRLFAANQPSVVPKGTQLHDAVFPELFHHDALQSQPVCRLAACSPASGRGQADCGVQGLERGGFAFCDNSEVSSGPQRRRDRGARVCGRGRHPLRDSYFHLSHC